MSTRAIRILRRTILASVAATAFMPALASAQEATEEDTGGDVGDIVVTGTLLRGAAPVGSSVISVGQAELEATGATTANELLASVPQATNLFNSVPTGQLTYGAGSVQVVRPVLRDLSNPASSSTSTLILFDGHRLAPVGITQNAVDPDIIPAAAIDRVEIVPDGGSATYGADAVGGVINFILRKKFDGIQADAKYGFADNYYQVQANGIVGKDWGSGSLFAAYTYQHNDSMFGRDRDFIRQIDWNTNLGVGRSCNPGNVQFRTFDFSTFSFLTTNFALPGLAANSVNSCDLTDDKAFIPTSTRHGAFAGLHQELSDWLTVDLRGFYGKRTSHTYSAFVGNVDVTSSQAFYRPIPGQDPTATQTVFFTLAPVLGRNSADSAVGFEEWGANAEFEAKLDDNWQMKTLFNYSRSSSEFTIAQLNSPLLVAAGSASNPQAAVNFYNSSATPNLDLIRRIASGEAAGQGKYDLFNARSILDGSLFSLPGGDVRLAVGYEYTHDAFAQRISPPDGLKGDILTQPFTHYNRRVHSAFGEVQVPIFGDDNRVGGIYSLVLSGSVRYDHFSDFGSTTNPKIAVTYKPVSWLSLRGNYSTSFNAPSPVNQLGSLVNTISHQYFVNAFVRQGDSPNVTGLVALTGSAPNLKPQTANTWSVGFDAEPPIVPGLRASVNYYNIKFANLISFPTPGPGIFTDFPGNIQADVNGVTVGQLLAFAPLAPNGPSEIATVIAERCPNTAAATRCAIYEIIDFRTANYGELRVSGLDFAFNYRMTTGFGALDAGISGNYTLTRELSANAGAVLVDQLQPSSANRGRLAAQLSLGADIGNFRAQATLNHTSGFDIVASAEQPQDRVKAFNVVNLFFKYDVPTQSAVLKDLSLTLNVNNVFNQDPPTFKLSSGNGYPENYFTIGRVVQVGFSKKF